MKARSLRLLCLLLAAMALMTALPAHAFAAEAQPSLAERAQSAQREIRTSKVGMYGMVPIYARDIKDGTYDIKVDSSSPFFRILSARLTVKGGEMTAEITISSLSYLYVYPGTAEEAERAKSDSYIGYKDDGGHGVFTIPVPALDYGTDCAAYSKKRKIWYDRTLVFYASSLPEEALDIKLPDYELIEAAIKAYEGGGGVSDIPPESSESEPEPVEINRSDGEYSIEVNMTGGSGRASISSPTLLTIRDGKAYAKLIWSSSHYDYMIVEDETYLNLTTDGGNSTFEIPVTVMDDGMPVIADTTAMGEPLEIEYTLTFYSESIGPKSLIPQEAAKKVLIIAAVLLIGGGIANYFIKKKRK